MNRKVLQKIEILPTIISEIKKAEIEILIVSAWFSDEKLFDVLVKKQKQGIKVKLILKDYLKNEKIKLSRLSKEGGEVYIIEKEAYGMMEKKYCIIDEKIVILAMFNWSANIIVNNLESIIVTDEGNTIQNAKINFYKMKEHTFKIEKNGFCYSFLAWITKKCFKCFKGKGRKAPQNLNESETENNVKSKKEAMFKMIKPSESLEDEFKTFFQNRN
jgi:phosphatidylserine/phosphatidylglycerophosphate/cardiolipin synthase-like enzyme